MSEEKLHDELLKQDGASSRGNEDLARLRQWVEDDRKSARRLMRWTIGVWLGWIACILVSVGVLMASHAPRPQAGPAPPGAGDRTPVQDVRQSDLLVALAAGQNGRDRPTMAFGAQVDLG